MKSSGSFSKCTTIKMFRLFVFIEVLAVNVIFFPALSSVQKQENSSTIRMNQCLIDSLKTDTGILRVKSEGGVCRVEISYEKETLLSQPADGLWSIALDWEKNWPKDWRHGQVQSVRRVGPWLELTGTVNTRKGDWKVRDVYIAEGQRIRCVRRWEWAGQDSTRKVTLSVRWMVPTTNSKVMMPGFCYYGNPSGSADRVAKYTGSKPGEELFCEEHRLSMPFISLEWEKPSRFYGASLHTLPSLASYANIADQWWSVGVVRQERSTELSLLSGPCSINGSRGFVKGNQNKNFPYPDTYLNVPPGAIIEKTFYLQTYPVERKGTGFYAPLQESLNIFHPFNLDGFPTLTQIIEAKYRYSLSRWHEGAYSAGFRKYPDRKEYVMGWTGQAEVPGYAFLALAGRLQNPQNINMVQRSLDHLTTSPVNEQGFLNWYDPDKNLWSRQDLVSQGQAMETFARAINIGRKTKSIDVSKWETFLRKTCDVHAKRILDEKWHPVSTNEGFLVSPLCKAYKLFGVEIYRLAAVKAVGYYATRHLDMTEPYWGGTLDAKCEDKEGAWAGFQAFLAVYEMTREQKYLQWAEHAMNVMLSWTVVWDIPMPPGRLRDHDLKTRGWTVVSAQNQHLDVFGVLYTPEIYRMGGYLHRDDLKKLAIVMFRSCGQMIDPEGSQGEQFNHTNFAQMSPPIEDAHYMRGTYNETWTVFWITAYFLNAASQFEEMGVSLD